MKILILILILSFPVNILSEILYINGRASIEIFSKYDLFPEYESIGYTQRINEVDNGYNIKVVSSITDDSILNMRFNQNPSHTNYKDRHIIDLVSEITRDSRYVYEAVEALVFWVRSNIRYNALLRTKKPSTLRQILLKEEGTCVDIVFVLSEMLDAAGINNNIIRGVVLDDSEATLHRWLEIENGKGDFIQLDPLASLFFITPNYFFIKKADRYSKAYYDFPIMEKLKHIELKKARYNYYPVGKISEHDLDIMIARNINKTSGIIVKDRDSRFQEIIIKGRDQVYSLDRDKVFTFSIFDLDRGRYEIYFKNGINRIFLRTIYIRNEELYFAGT